MGVAMNYLCAHAKDPPFVRIFCSLQYWATVLGQQLVCGGTRSAIAIFGALLLDLERMGKHAGCGLFAHEVLCGALGKANELVNRGVVAVDGVQQLCSRGVCVGARCDGVFPALGSGDGVLGAR